MGETVIVWGGCGKGVVVMKGVMARVAWWKRGGVLVRDKGRRGTIKGLQWLRKERWEKNCGLWNGVERCEG